MDMKKVFGFLCEVSCDEFSFSHMDENGQEGTISYYFDASPALSQLVLIDMPKEMNAGNIHADYLGVIPKFDELFELSSNLYQFISNNQKLN